MRCAFIGTPDFSVPSLESIIKSKHTVEFIFTSLDKPRNRGKKLLPTPVKKCGLSNDIKIYQDRKIFKKYEGLFETIDIGVVVASFFFIPKWLLNIPRFGFINLHPSLLPKYRGAAPVAFSLLSGDSKTGISIIKLNEKMDSGPILLQRKVDILRHERKGALEQRLSELGADEIVRCLDMLEAGKIEETPQNDDNASYTRKLSRDDARLDFSKKAIDLENTIRAFHPWPGTFALLNGKVIKIKSAYSIDENTNNPIGKVFSIDGKIAVSCGEGSLVLDRIQPESKKECDVEDFCRGNKFIGEMLSA